MKSRIFIVDRHALIRRGLVELINSQADMEVCGEAEDGKKALSAIMELRPDLVTMEISLEGNSGMELIKCIREFDPQIGILVVSMCDESVYASRALRAGARGFVNKRDRDEGILRAMRRIHGGRLSFSAEVEDQMLACFVRGEHKEESAVSRLSDRELEVGHHIGSGATTREIAKRLHVSIKTIETHRARIKVKLGLTNSARLVQFWINWIGNAEARSHSLMPGLPAQPGPTSQASTHPARRRRSGETSVLSNGIRRAAGDDTNARMMEDRPMLKPAARKDPALAIS